MELSINLSLTLCTLYLFVNAGPNVIASRRPQTTGDKRGAAARKARGVYKPTPIDCVMSRWSTWTPCNSCTDKKFRFRYLEKPAQFGGTECLENLWDTLACPRATTQCLVPDYCGERFTCKESGRCISQSLRCNGEQDCDDFSDEEDCENVNWRNDKCSTLLPIPGAQKAIRGFNILTGELMDRVLDANYFGGECEYVYNGEWRKFTYDSFCESLQYNDEEKNYRKPYNYHSYRFVAEARSEGTQESYDDVVSLLKARKKSGSSNFGFSVGIYYVEGKLSASSESEFLSNLTNHRSENLEFVRLWSQVETARFKMRSNKLMLHDDLYISLMDLPEEYNFGMYSQFFNKFGTHYVTEGTMGGTLEFVLVLNKTSMEKSEINAHQIGSCFGASIGVNIPITDGLAVDFSAGVKPCNKNGDYTKVYDSSSSLIEDIITNVDGGILDISGSLLAIRNPDTYKNWGASLKSNPTLIKYEIMPIYELLRFSTAADHVGARMANLKRGLDEYLQQFDSCRCAPCKHNGIPVLMGNSCKCICKSGFKGEACEMTYRGAVKTDGSWSCWGAWSLCGPGKKTRTRTCDNPRPEGAGATCLGSSSQTQRC